VAETRPNQETLDNQSYCLHTQGRRPLLELGPPIALANVLHQIDYAAHRINSTSGSEVFPESGAAASSTVHVMTRAGTNRADLLRLAHEALEEHLQSRHPVSATA